MCRVAFLVSAGDGPVPWEDLLFWTWGPQDVKASECTSILVLSVDAQLPLTWIP